MGFMRRLAVTALAGGLIAGLTTTVAVASPTQRSTCAPSAQALGQCLTFAAEPGQNRTVAAVREALGPNGAGSQAAKEFVAKRAQTHNDATQQTINMLVTKTEENSGIHDDTAIPADGAGDRGDGVADTPYSMNMDKYPDYGFCDPDGCAIYGSLYMHYRISNFFYPESVLSGQIQVYNGPAIYISQDACVVYQDKDLLPDPEIGSFTNCGTGTADPYYTFNDQTKTFDHTPNGYYYLSADICWNMDGGGETFCLQDGPYESIRWMGDGTFPKYSA